MQCRKKRWRIRISARPELINEMIKNPEIIKHIAQIYNENTAVTIQRGNHAKIADKKLPVISQLLTVVDIIGRWVL